MDITQRRKRGKVVGSIDNLYPHDLQLYKFPPLNDISLMEFEELALERLKVLRVIDQISLRGNLKSLEEKKAATIEELNKEGLKLFARLMTGAGCGKTEADFKARRRDHISHFILRLAYCRSEDLRRWFISKELELFRLRFHSLNKEGIREFFQLNNLNYIPISEAEKTKLRDRLNDSTLSVSAVLLEGMDFYKVPFTDVLDLVKTRRVFLKSGYAYVPSSDFVSILQSLLRATISESLARTLRQLPNVERDERLYCLLKGLHHSYTGNNYCISQSSSGVKIEDLDKLSQQSYPLCMRKLHEALRSKHHLRHGGRMQYGLFLKGIGVSLEDSMRFWRDEFTKSMDVDKFEKQYAYNIRHNYGKEGKQTNYSPYSCMKIILQSVGPEDNHGCPFKHSDVDNLKQQLMKYGLPAASVQEITSYVTQGHYQIACGKYFEVTHGIQSENGIGINHPNQYFEESQKLLRASGGIKAEPDPKCNTSMQSGPSRVEPSAKDD